MNLRKKILVSAQLGALGSMLFASFSYAGALKTGSNSVSVPVAVSFPLASSALDEAVIRFGRARFLEGFDIVQKMDDVTIHDPFEIQLKGVQFRSRVQGRLGVDSAGLIAEANLQNAEIMIDSISIHSVVSTRVAGVEAKIRIDADCKGSLISWRGQSLALFARGKMQTRPALGVSVSNLALPANLPRPEMVLSCTGPVGIEQSIREYAWAALQQRWSEDSFARKLELNMQNFFAESMKVGGPGLNIVNQPNMKMILHPVAYEVTANGSHFRAMLDVQLDRPLSVKVTKGDELVLPTGPIDSLMLTAPVSTVQFLVQALLTPGVWSEWLEAQTIKGFRDLMSSRFKQFFAFPDLMNYDKRSVFWFVMGMSSAPTLKCTATGIDLVAPVNARMLLQDSKFEIGYKSMVLFRLPTRVSFAFPRASRGITMTANIQSIEMSSEFDSRYVETESPNTSVAIDSILPEVQSYAQAKTRDLTALEGALGESVRLFNQTDVSCSGFEQMLHLRF